MSEREDNKITINITPGSFFKGILLVLLFWFLFYVKDILLVVLTAVVIASAIEPLVGWFKKFKIGRIPSVIISFFLLLSVIFSIMFVFVPEILKETTSLLNSLPKYLETTTLWNPLNMSTDKVTESQKVVTTLSESLNNPVSVVTEQIKSGNLGLVDLMNAVEGLTSSTADGFVKIMSIVFGGLFSFILIMVLSFYLSVQEDGVTKFLALITPVKQEKYIIDLWKRSQRKIGQWMQGQLLLCIIVAVLLYMGLMILGIENALLFALIAGCLEIIPIFGPIIASVPAIIAAFVGGGITPALLVAGLFLIVQQFENHLIYPLVVKKIVGVSPVIVILALIIGSRLAGFLGVVLSVPLISAFMEFVDDMEKRKTVFWQKANEREAQ